MDLCIETPKVEYRELDIERIGKKEEESSEVIRSRVVEARKLQKKRIRGNANSYKLYAWTGRNQDLYSIRQCGKKVDGEGI